MADGLTVTAEATLIIKNPCISKSLTILNDREKSIILDRRLKEPPLTLEQLSEKHGISRERVRQIENKAIDRLRDKVVEFC